MEWLAHKEEIKTIVKKYRYVLLIFLAGILLMCWPSGQKQPDTVQPAQPPEEVSMQASLEEILGQIAGAGRVSVLLTEKSGEETVYQTNEDRSSGGDREDIRRETVLVSDGTRDKTGLVRQRKAPTYLGAVVVCQGADSAAVRLAVAQAVKSATGLSIDCISVLKMK